MGAQLLRFAASFGVTAMRFPDRSPNTRKALAMAEHARDEGRLHPFRRAAMDAHWLRGEDLEAREVLASCAAAAGLDPEKALAAMEEPSLRARVDAMGRDAARAGVTGIPTFLIGERRVVGCQPYEVLRATAETAGATHRFT